MGPEQGEKSSARADAIGFIVRFAHLDLVQMREGDWLNLQEDFAAFASPGLGLELHPSEPPIMLPPDQQALGKLRSLQMKLLELLQPIAASQSRLEPASRGGKIFAGTISGTFVSSQELGFGVSHEPGVAPSLVLSGDYLHLLYVKAALLLLVVRDTAVTRLRLCPECLAVFLRVRKQRYCSRRCVNQANMRAWLQRNKGKVSHRASARRSYEKRIRRVLPKAKIGRNVRAKK